MAQVRRFGRVLPGLGPLLTDLVALKVDAGDGAVRPEDLGEGLAARGDPSAWGRWGRALPGLGPLVTEPFCCELQVGDAAVRLEGLLYGLTRTQGGCDRT